MGNDALCADRVRISTLLAVREMLIMNAEKIFPFASLNQATNESVERDRTWRLRGFAGAIVRNTAKRLHSCHPESHFFDDFIQATRNYDARSEDFQFSLAQADVRPVYTRSGGRDIGQEESVLAKVSFNYARAKHPLLCNNKRAVEDGGGVQVPAPTACAVFQIESNATCDRTGDAVQTFESL